MPRVARMVSRAKWSKAEGLVEGEIPADALGDLRTTKNELSFWRIDDNDDPWWREVALALAAARERLDPIDVIEIEEAALDAASLDMADTPGDTPVVDLVERHVDVVHLDTVRLCAIAGVVRDAIGSVHSLTKAEVKKLLRAAIEAGRLNVSELPEKLRAALV